MKKVLLKTNTGFRIINYSYWESIRKKLPSKISSTILSHDESCRLMELFGDSFNSNSIDKILLSIHDNNNIMDTLNIVDLGGFFK